MICNFSDLRNKEVVSVQTGLKLGYIDDIELNTADNTVMSLVIFGRPRAFGMFGRDDDIIIKCENIQLIGEDTILVNTSDSSIFTKSRSFSVENLLKY